MYFPLLATSLSLLSFTQAGEHPFNFKFQGDTCSIAEKSVFPNFSIPQIEEEHQHGSGSCSHHRHAEEKSRYSPWTHKRQCITDEESWEEYCVYTNANFANGRGISFFTLPSIAKKVESLPAFVHRGIHDNTNKFVDSPWEIRNVPGRGNGLFATRTLHRGDEILSDTPVGVYQSDAFFADYLIGYQYLRKTFDQMPNETQEIILRTAAHSPGDPIMERINTNAFSGEFEGAPHFLLYPETALMNHDCRPNSMFYHDPSSLIHTTYASRTILPGEEITITYINLLQPRHERQSILKSIWGFDCTCSLCSGNPGEMQISDGRIHQIQEFQTTLTDWSANSLATPQMAEKLLALYEQEQVHAARGTGHMFAALAYNAVGDISRAKKHARLAIEVGMVSTGEKDADVAEMTALRDNPKGHWSYLARRAR